MTTQAERLARRAELREEIEKRRAELQELLAEEARVLDGCEHVYADGRSASTGGRVRICAICGQLPKHREEKLWG
jgi:hypothetical protein